MSPAQQQQFEQFWRTYPRRVGKLAAQREWERRHPDLDTVLTALAQQRQQWTDPKFTPHPATWLHQGRWLDEAPTPTLPSLAEDGDWWADCQQRHGGRCNGRMAHGIRCELDAVNEARDGQ